MATIARHYTVEDLARRGAPKLLGWLIARRNMAPLTYGEVARRLERSLNIGKIFSTHIGYVAGQMMEDIQEIRPRAPLINAMVVNQSDHLPGEGIAPFYKERFGDRYADYIDMPRQERERITARAVREVRAYRGWDVIYKKRYGGPAPGPDSELLHTSERDGKSPDGRRGGGGESPYHKRLKYYVACHPRLVSSRLNAGTRGTPEAPLLSGDTVDVRFIQESLTLLVEVKSRISNSNDLERGVYQCVKYRAVMLAQEHPHISDVRVVLVLEVAPPLDIVKRCRELKVEIKQIKVPNSFALSEE